MRHLETSWARRIVGVFVDPRSWVWSAVLVSLLVVGLIAWIHTEQVKTQDRAIAALGSLRQARVDLAKGFLYTSLSTDDSSPFDRQEGFALLLQAITEFEDSRDQLAAGSLSSDDPEIDGAASLAAFSDAVLAFRSSLSEQTEIGERDPAEDTRLRNAFYELESQADRLDSLGQIALDNDADRLSRDFLGVIVVAAVLLLVISCGLYFAGVAQRRSRAALREGERRWLEREEQLQQSRRLEAIGRLAGGVAHDLNNLLTPILGYTEVVLEELPATDPHREMVTEINRAAVRAADLVRQLLAFGRRQSLEIQSVDLNKTVQDLLRLLRRTTRENITIELRLAPTVPAVNGDAGQIEQVIMNLAVNGQDAMPDGGTLTLGTEEARLDEDRVEGALSLAPGTYAVLIVTDNGHGIDPETKARIFEPFFTTKDTGKGTGLGLATVHGIIKQHRGEIDVLTEVGKGTTFRVYFPVADGEADVRPQGERAPKAAARGRETILLAEDEPAVRRLTSRVLVRQGYKVIEAADGREALMAFSRTADTVDLLLADVIMPDLSGPELFERLSKISGKLKVLYMSGYAGEAIAAHGLQTKGADMVGKPFTTADLLEKVREVLDRPSPHPQSLRAGDDPG